MFKSNYAANQKRYHISYINTFKDIFLIILFFFSDNILRRNLINTLRETWVQHANVQRARGSSIRPAAAAALCQHLPVTRPPGERLPGPFAGGWLSQVRTPSGSELGPIGEKEEFLSLMMCNRRVLRVLSLPFFHSFRPSFIQQNTP